jgi:hypothetical protein
MVINQYDHALHSFKIWVFPFAHYYLEDLTLPSVDQSGNETFETLANSASTNIASLKDKFTTYMTSIVSYDRHLHSKVFQGSKSHGTSFYVWKSQIIVENLLRGKKVSLYANPKNSPAGLDAIKFRNLKLDFVMSADNGLKPDIQSEMNKNYQINMTHMGRSFYRLDNQVSFIHLYSRCVTILTK